MNTYVLSQFEYENYVTIIIKLHIANSPKAHSSKQKLDNDRDVILSSLYIYHFSAVVDSHPISAEVLMDTGTPGTSREIYSKNADDGN